ncbi:MAG: hypothetical protein LBO71_07985 [Prevotellaceae bacterium]|jgi:hypothetical protein|nr:hypothetical protein [Prevotellaceae bacterium]
MDTQKPYNEEVHPKTCIIANPIYDTVFKKLMENERIAKFFLSTVLEQQVVSVDVRPQEFTYKKAQKPAPAPTDIGYSIFRIDFMATIETAQGEQKKILIEVQKSHDEDDLIRFRSYLGEQYKKLDRVNGVEIVLPITTIYILGFNLADISSPCVKVERTYVDMIHKKRIEVKAPFIEKLTHNSYVIQAKRITDERCSTKLDRLLSLFEQAHFISAESKIGKQYLHPSGDEEIQFITSLLHEIIADPKEREEIEKEEEALRIIETLYGKKSREQKQIIEEQAKALEEKDKALEGQAKALEGQAKVLEGQARVLEEQAKQIAALKQLLKKS